MHWTTVYQAEVKNMNSYNVQLTEKDILEKEFKTSIRGYNQEEVDEFLDIIIQDYDKFQKKIDQLEREIDQLKRSSSQTQARTRMHQPTQQVNYDILQRLSNLEKEVFGKKMAEP